MNGSRKMQMMKFTQWMAFAVVLLFMMLKAFASGGAPGLTPEILLYGLVGVGANFGAFVAGNVLGDHRGKKDAPATGS